MIALRVSLIVLSLSASGAHADEVRTITPARQSLIPTGSDTDARKAQSDPGALKPRGQDVPSPILVELKASIDADGRASLDCAASGTHDFRTTPSPSQTEHER